MVWSACLALVLACLVHFLPSLPGLLLIPELLVGCALLTWLAWGPRSGAALIPAIGVLFNAGWATGDRLGSALVKQDIFVRGTVCALPRTEANVHRFVFEPAGDLRPRGLPKRIYLSWYEATAFPEAGERWQLKVRLKRPRGLRNPGAFDYERWAHRHRVGATGYVRRSVLNRRITTESADCRLAGMRQRIARRLENALAPSPAAGHLLALSVGARHGLSEADWGLLRRTGTIHLMAISGLHVGLVTGLLLFLGRHLGRALLFAGIQIAPLFVGRWCAVTGAAAYCALAGFSLPTVRALVMVAVVMALATVRRSIPAWRILATALFAVLLVEPSAPLAAGFWLSFYAVGLLLLQSLALTSPVPGPGIMQAFGRTGSLVRAQFALTIGLAPLSILYFAQVSIVAPICNLLVVPLFALAVVPLTLLGTICLSLGLSLSESIGRFFLAPAAWVMEAILRFLTWLDNAPFTVWYPPPLSMTSLIVIVFGTLILVWPRPFPRRAMVVMSLLPVLGGSSLPAPPVMRIVVMDVGQGLSVLIQTAEHALVYDAGPAFRTRDAGRSVILPVLRQFGVRRLDTLLISHGDADHIGGAKSLLARFPDAELIAPAGAALDTRRYRPCATGIEWRWDGVRFRILHPGEPDRPRWSENDGSCVLLVESARAGVLLPGDIERRAEIELVRNARVPAVDLAVDLVVAPHHGSDSSSSDRFIRATRPRFVVFSAGHLNRWGFPDSGVLDRWRQAGACALTTADTGALVFEIDDTGRLQLTERHRIDARRIWTEVDGGVDQQCSEQVSASTARS